MDRWFKEGVVAWAHVVCVPVSRLFGAGQAEDSPPHYSPEGGGSYPVRAASSSCKIHPARDGFIEWRVIHLFDNPLIQLSSVRSVV